MERAIVTGATGFIGSWLVEKLVEMDVAVTALVVEGEERLSPAVRSAIRIVRYDPENIAGASDAVPTECDVFYNLGWAGVAPEHKGDLAIQTRNIGTALETLQFAAARKCKRFIGAGTVGEYVFCDGLISPKQPPSPGDIYGAAKVAAHYMSQLAARQLKLPFNWVILPSTFGERRTDNNIISYSIRTLLAGDRPSYAALDQMWDFLYIADVVNALYLIGEQGVAGKCYGIGSGVYKPLRAYIEEIRDLIDPSLPLGIGERESGEGVSSSCVDNSELIADTSFRPAIPFTEGIVRTIRYFKENIK